MAIQRAQLEAATEALGMVLKFDQPADVLLHHFFRNRPALGSRDRAFVAESVFGILRHKRFIDHLVPNAAPRRTLLAYLTRIAGISVREIAPLLSSAEADAVGSLKALTPETLPLGVNAELPDWIVERLCSAMP